MAGLLLALAVPMSGYSTGYTSRARLAWDASTDASVIGYRLYWGLASRSYTSVTNAGAATSFSIAGLTPGTNYFLAVTAYTANGLESPYSTEISYVVPPAPPTLRLTVNVSKQAVLTGVGPGGYSYDVLTRGNAIKWTTKGTVTISAGGTFQFTDPRRATNGLCLYRLRQR